MKIAFVVYDGVTLLDFAGAYDPLTRLKTMGFVPDLEYDICARAGTVRSFEGVTISADTINPDLSAYDYVVVPGGNGIAGLMQDRAFLSWLTIPPEKTVIAAVCGGALLIGAAGMLHTRRATTHPAMQEILKRFAREVSSARIVEDNRVITAGGVTAAIDMGLYLCEKIAGEEARAKIQKQMDYPYYPPRPGTIPESGTFR
ncbi:DJ-1/PfpI family protein [Methanoregula sp.]|uniref:DJ-1/PfpI family protein n=1 Tax=Methanoregula sp. TaxID=2052170 RepID=UPI0035641707